MAARIFRLRSPRNVIHEGRNLALFVRRNLQLFNADDVNWVHGFCRALQGLRSLNPNRTRPEGSWKGWTWFSQVERIKNGGDDLLHRVVGLLPIYASDKLKDDLKAIVASVAVDLPSVHDGKLPDEIMWMPPGAHTINASQGGMPVSLGVNVNEEGAQNIQKAFEQIQEAAAKGEEDRMYLDLNHSDEEASAWPIGFRWAGDDPLNGGIRVSVEWSSAGKEAVLGKTYRRFSPSFYVDQNGIVIGAPVNAGGLVNRAAFRKMQPIWSKSSREDEDPANKPQHEEEQPTMKSLLSVLASQGLLKSADVDEGTAVTQLTAALTERSTKASATETELTQVNAKFGALEKKHNDLVKAHATSVVDAAIAAARIPGQNDELKAKWVGLIQADPTNASLLPEPNAALQQVIQASGKDKGKADLAGEHEFMVKAKEYLAEHKVSEAFAFQKIAASQPKLYDSYRESLLRNK